MVCCFFMHIIKCLIHPWGSREHIVTIEYITTTGHFEIRLKRKFPKSL